MTQRRTFTAEFKTQVVLDLVSGAITAIDRVPVFYFLFDLAIGLFVSYLLSCTTVALYGILRKPKQKKK